MSGFWAGAVPPWAFVALVVLVILVIGGIALGAWYGYGRGFAHAEEEARWAREQAKARRSHPAYRQPPELTHEHEACDPGQACWCGYMAPWPEPAITTGEIEAITDEMDAWLAEHVYGAPRDYGQWLEQQDRS